MLDLLHFIMVCAFRFSRCNLCGKSFDKNHSLTRHLKIHTDNRPYQCDICSKTFRAAFNLDYHKRTHIGKADRCVACPFCKRKVLIGRGARRHLRLYHGINCSNEDAAKSVMKRTASRNELAGVCHKFLEVTPLHFSSFDGKTSRTFFLCSRRG